MAAAVEKRRQLNVDSFLKTLDSTNGRDKLGKVMQYAARFAAWYLAKYNPTEKEYITRATSVQKGIASARKLTRLLKFWPLLIKLQDSLLKKGLNQPLADHLRNLSSFGMANYFFWDGISWAIGINLMKGDNAKYSKWAMWGWFWGLFFAILVDTVELIKLSHAAPKTDQKESKGCCSALCSPTAKKFFLSYAKNISDLSIAAKGTQLVDISEGVLGIAGIVAGVVGWYELWPQS